jgi:hypothetical protein
VRSAKVALLPAATLSLHSLLPLTCRGGVCVIRTALCHAAADTYWATGRLNPKPIIMWNGVYPGGTPQAVITVLYSGGDDWRNTYITITENRNLTKAVAQFLSESPFLWVRLQHARARCDCSANPCWFSAYGVAGSTTSLCRCRD